MSQETVVELLARDLLRGNGVHCPNPQANMKLWNTHPRIYLELGHAGETKCPYCGTVYRLKAGEVVAGVH